MKITLRKRYYEKWQEGEQEKVKWLLIELSVQWLQKKNQKCEEASIYINVWSLLANLSILRRRDRRLDWAQSYKNCYGTYAKNHLYKPEKWSKQPIQTCKLQVKFWYDSPRRLGFTGNELKQWQWEKNEGGVENSKPWWRYMLYSESNEVRG